MRDPDGISYHGLFRASGATFTVFTDYCRASIRLAALAKPPNAYIFTHDSIGVGEDGPTHEPVETITSVRVMPNIDVLRPAYPEETAGAFVAAGEDDQFQRTTLVFCNVTAAPDPFAPGLKIDIVRRSERPVESAQLAWGHQFVPSRQQMLRRSPPDRPGRITSMFGITRTELIVSTG